MADVTVTFSPEPFPDYLQSCGSLSPPYIETDLIPVVRNGQTYSITGDQLISVSGEQQGWGSIVAMGATGSGDETAILAAAEDSAFDVINLCGLTITTTTNLTTLTKRYFNGQLIGRNNAAKDAYLKAEPPFSDETLERRRNRSPLTTWAGTNVLWLGTSIPAQGLNVDGYPEQFGQALNCTVLNMAWAGSHVNFDPAADPYSNITIRALSMTEDDRLAGLALYGPSSAYDDSFDPVTKPSRMTADFIIKSKFATLGFDAVIFDHAHNDRQSAPGVLSPAPLPIVAITKGATTTVTLAAPGLVTVGDGVALSNIVGIALLNNAAARVQSVSGADFTLNINSSAFAGSFTSGNAIKYDRSTIFGSFQFVLHYIYWCASLYGISPPAIVLAGAPSEFTGDNPDPWVWSISKLIRDIADKWGLPFFDIAYSYSVTERDHIVWFPDTVHPTTFETRRSLANHWVQWANGGTLPSGGSGSSTGFLPRGGTGEFLDQHEALYSRLLGGFATPKYIIGDTSSAFADDFSAGLGAWTTAGTAPVIEVAPWAADEYAIKCASAVGATTSYLQKDIGLDGYWSCEFDVLFPAVSGATTVAAATIALAQIFSGLSTAYYQIEAVMTPTATHLDVTYFAAPFPPGPLIRVPTRTVLLAANTKYHVKVESIRATDSHSGQVLLYLNDEIIAGPDETTDSAMMTPGRVRFGVPFCNTNNNLTVYLGNVEFNKSIVHDYLTRATSSFESFDGHTVSVVNGIITDLATPRYSVGLPTTVVDEDFSGGLPGAWTTVGTAPVVESAPWDAGMSAIKCVSAVGATTSYLRQNVALDDAWSVEFDVWFPVVSGITTVPVATVALAQILSSTTDAYYQIEALVYATTIRLRVSYFDAPFPSGNLIHSAIPSAQLAANTKYTIKVEAVRATVDYPGAMTLSLDGTPLLGPIDTTDVGMADPGQVRFGVVACNTGDDLTAYLGNIVVTKSVVGPYPQRYTGTFTAVGGGTVTVVNGVITSFA